MSKLQYNTIKVCTYHTEEVFLPTDNITEEERQFIRDAIYRQELLDILEMEEFNEGEFFQIIEQLYKKISDCNELIDCIKKVAYNFIQIEQEKENEDSKMIGFMILFSYDYLCIIHPCICDYINNNQLNQENKLILERLILPNNA